MISILNGLVFFLPQLLWVQFQVLLLLLLCLRLSSSPNAMPCHARSRSKIERDTFLRISTLKDGLTVANKNIGIFPECSFTRVCTRRAFYLQCIWRTFHRSITDQFAIYSEEILYEDDLCKSWQLYSKLSQTLLSNGGPWKVSDGHKYLNYNRGWWLYYYSTVIVRTSIHHSNHEFNWAISYRFERANKQTSPSSRWNREGCTELKDYGARSRQRRRRYATNIPTEFPAQF